MWQAVVQGIMDLLWPPRCTCLLCQEKLDGLVKPPVCSDCWGAMRLPDGLPLCKNCSRPLTSPADMCADCLEGVSFGHVWALGLHAGSLREAIHALKFEGREDLGAPLGGQIAAIIGEEYDWVVPIPLHWRRQRERGYNQAAAIAQGIAAATGWTVADRALKRAKSTGRQTKLDRTERLQNLSGAFLVEPGVDWRGARILLVDDVLTTGATLASAADAVWAAGAAVVDVAVLAVSLTPMRPGYLQNSH